MIPRLRDLGCAVALAGFLCGEARAQFSPPDLNFARSSSGQFIVTRSGQPSALASQVTTITNAALLRLEPPLLAVSAERIKESLWRELGMNLTTAWRGQINLALHPAQSLDEGAPIVALPGRAGWNYRVELPDVLPRTQFSRVMTGVLLAEYAGRNAPSTDRSVEIPVWLVDGLSSQLLATGGRENILSPPGPTDGAFALAQTVALQGSVDSSAEARRVLRSQPALTFKELSWPTGAQLAGDDGGVYLASAQVFTSELLKLKTGPAHLRAMLETLTDFYNWQNAFQSAFRELFPRPLDVEKWWSLTVVSLATRDVSSIWTPANSCTRLAEIISVPVELRSTSNALPVHAEISLQAVIRQWDAARRTAILQSKLRDLEQAQFRMAAPLAALTASYRQAIADYLGVSKPDDGVKQFTKHPPAAPKKPDPNLTLKQLDALDEQRRQIESDILKPAP
jgi:hypothetical protein